MKWTIDKSFSASMGHRVHNQRLDTNFTESGDSCLACRHLHGHEMLIKVFLEADSKNSNINKTGMVTDFKHLGWFKNFIDDVVDHKFIMDIQDPLLKFEVPFVCNDEGLDYNLCFKMIENYYIADLTKIKQQISQIENITDKEQDAIFEKYEGMVFVDFVPTSENLTKWLFDIVNNKMSSLEGVIVKAVEYWETPKSHCRIEI